MDLRLLGAFEARDEGGEAIRLPTRKVRALMSYLALQPERRFSRADLASLLWEDEEDANARQSLRQSLSVLRRVCPLLEAQRAFVRLPAGAVVTDVGRLEAALDAGDLDSLAAAASLHQGDLLQDLEMGSERFQQWLYAERNRVSAVMTTLMGRLVEALAQSGDLPSASAWARRLVNEDPYDERRHRAYMSLLARSGEQRAALKHFDDLRAFLQRELGVAPDAQTKRLASEMTVQSPLPEGAMLDRLQRLLESLTAFSGSTKVRARLRNKASADPSVEGARAEPTLETGAGAPLVCIPLRSPTGALQGYLTLESADWPARAGRARASDALTENQ